MIAGSATAEDPVYFADANLKAAVEELLGINDPTPSDMLGLASLDASSLGITHLTGLEYATNLQQLDLGFNQISNIQLLSGLFNLQTLTINDNQISDFSPLSDLGQLEDLNIHRNPISDLKFLDGLPSPLKKLTLRYMQISDISPLSSLTHLQELDLYQTQISDISALASLTALKTLYITYNHISDLSPLAGLIHLEFISARLNQIIDISSLSGLTNLHYLYLDNNKIKDISALSGLTSLKELELTSNPLNQDTCSTYISMIITNNPGLSFLHDCGLSLSHRLVISSTAGGSVIEPGKGEFTYDIGTMILLRAKADPGFVFSHWSGSLFSTQNFLSLTMDQGYEIRANFRSILNTLYVDDDAPGDPQPGDLSVSDPQENGSTDHPFDSIQKAIDVAGNNTMVVIRPGTYFEDINLLGKSIHLTGLDPNRPSAITDYPVIAGTGSGPIVRFASGEDPNCRLSGFVIAQPKALTAYAILCSKASPSFDHCLIVGNRSSASTGAAILCQDSRALFDHCTLADNQAGPQGAALALIDSNVLITHSILWGNAPKDVLLTGTSLPTITYTDLTGVWPGLGTIDDDPLFARHGYWADPEDPNTTMKPSDPRAVWVAGDYHLRSQVGRWDVKVGTWIVDEVTSPCIDAGDPARPVGYESIPNGEIVNLGAYGGTAQASRSDVGPIPL
jgi:hypothetical protein